MSDSDIDNLCQSIYQRHKRALDLIFERRPDRQASVKAELETLIKDTPGIRLRYNTKTKIGFHPTDWDVPALQGEKGEATDALLLEFYFDNLPSELKLTLYINDGDKGSRERLLAMARANASLFRPPRRTATVNQILSEQWLSPQALEEADIEGIRITLRAPNKTGICVRRTLGRRPPRRVFQCPTNGFVRRF